MPRRKPYTEIGIRRLKCVRCGAQAREQWKACADGVWRPICLECDVLLNEIALEFMRVPDRARKMDRYRRKRWPCVTMERRLGIPCHTCVMLSRGGTR